ncbi:hypothetical protein ACQKMI_13265 [Lysinibacillus sp. NPDC097214]|uniref:hypothetical protein n=1 Tax=Lysinibacillus sp. NPDC097214 TaxID=3390584 RepID=UPI003CFFAEF8
MGQRDVGHSVVATGRGVLRLSSSFQWMYGHPLESKLKPASISPPIEVGDFYNCRFTYVT